jgi:hypothetical protein
MRNMRRSLPAVIAAPVEKLDVYSFSSPILNYYSAPDELWQVVSYPLAIPEWGTLCNAAALLYHHAE